ncbi:MAG TPA: monofunctional biosynthetic peptidoglycan transglycosylase [Gammaproteobacteria bacterium]
MRRIKRLIIVPILILLASGIALVLPLRWIEPPASSFMLQARLMDDRVIYHQWQPLSRISPHLQMAVIAAEDQKFPTHFGFDFESIADALDEKRSRRRGASTISQQVAKNLYLWNGRSYVRKGIEAYLTLWIEILWSKERILEVYLNIAEFGPGVYGAQAASRRYFHKPASQITPREAALLAAVLPNPKRMSAARPSRYVRDRATEILAVIPSLTDSFPIR